MFLGTILILTYIGVPIVFWLGVGYYMVYRKAAGRELVLEEAFADYMVMTMMWPLVASIMLCIWLWRAVLWPAKALGRRQQRRSEVLVARAALLCAELDKGRVGQ